MNLEELRARRAKDRLARKEAEFRALPANSGARYNPLWGLCKCAIDAGYSTHDTLRHYIDGIYLSQWGAIEPYIGGTVDHALKDTDTGKADAVRIERSKAVSAVKRKYAEATPEFTAWVRDKVMTAEPLPMKFDSIDGLDDETLSRDAMKAIVGDMAEGSYVYIGSGKADFNGVEGKSHSRIGFWQDVADAPNDPEHNSWCPNVLDAPHRNKEHVQEVRYLVMEMDRPLCGDRIRETADALEKQELTYDSQRRYWAYILSRGCLSVRSLVYSGGKSVHALIPIVCTKEEFAEKRDKIKACYLKLYMDDSMVDCAKKTRRPWGWRKMYYARNAEGVCVNAMDACALRDVPKEELEEFARENGIDVSNPWYILQDVLWLDADARPMTIDEFCGGMKAIFSEYIHDKTEEVEEAERRLQEPMPLVWVEHEDRVGNTTGKWEWDGRSIDGFLQNIGIAKYDLTDKSQGLMMRNETHIIRTLTIGSAWDTIYAYCKRKSPSMASELRDVYSRRFTDRALAVYTGSKTEVDLLWDDIDTSYIPYSNGVLKVTAGDRTLIPYNDDSLKGDIWDSSPTLGREWRDTQEKSEMETFLRHLCGSEECGREIAERRYEAMRSMLGYMVSRYKEHTNYAIILTDESLKQNAGGTGKSLMLEAVLKMRYGYKREASEEQGNQFQFSVISRDMNILGIDETSEAFDFRDLFTKTTGNWNIEHKFVDGKEVIPKKYAPKILICTNFIPRGLGDSHERRKRIYEVSQHYGRHYTVKDEFGHKLYEDWDREEWARFDNFMVGCLQKYISEGELVTPEDINVNLEYKTLLANIPSTPLEWLQESYVTRDNELVKLMAKDTVENYVEWCRRLGRKNDGYGRKKLESYIEMYCQARGITDDFKKRRVRVWEDGKEVEQSRLCHCFKFPEGYDDDPTVVRDAHEALLKGKPSEEQSTTAQKQDGEYPF